MAKRDLNEEALQKSNLDVECNDELQGVVTPTYIQAIKDHRKNVKNKENVDKERKEATEKALDSKKEIKRNEGSKAMHLEESLFEDVEEVEEVEDPRAEDDDLYTLVHNELFGDVNYHSKLGLGDNFYDADTQHVLDSKIIDRFRYNLEIPDSREFVCVKAIGDTEEERKESLKRAKALAKELKKLYSNLEYRTAGGHKYGFIVYNKADADTDSYETRLQLDKLTDAELKKLKNKVKRLDWEFIDDEDMFEYAIKRAERHGGKYEKLTPTEVDYIVAHKDIFYPRTTLGESEKSLKEGVGAGYTIEGTLDNFKLNSVKDFKDDPDNNQYYTGYIVDVDATAELSDIYAYSYYYGNEVASGGSVPVKINQIVISTWGLDSENPSLETITDYVRDEFLGLESEAQAEYGGGWSHVSFDGELVFTLKSENTRISEVVCDIENQRVIDAIDKAVTGEDWEEEFVVVDENDDPIEFFEDEDEAVAYAKKNRGARVDKRETQYALMKDLESEDISDWGDSEIVWEREYTKSYRYDDVDEGLKKPMEMEKELKESYGAGRDALEDLIDRAKLAIDDGDDLDEAVESAIDDGLIYDEDIINLAEYYGVIDTRDLIEKFYEELYADIYSEVKGYKSTKNLPSQVTIAFEELDRLVDDWDDEDEVEEVIGDYLSDEEDFLVNGFNYEIKRDEDGDIKEVLVSNIDWDIDEGCKTKKGKESLKEEEEDFEVDDDFCDYVEETKDEVITEDVTCEVKVETKDDDEDKVVVDDETNKVDIEVDDDFVCDDDFC